MCKRCEDAMRYLRECAARQRWRLKELLVVVVDVVEVVVVRSSGTVSAPAFIPTGPRHGWLPVRQTCTN